MYAFDVIIEPVLLSSSAIHLPWQKVGFESKFQIKNEKLNDRKNVQVPTLPMCKFRPYQKCASHKKTLN